MDFYAKYIKQLFICLFDFCFVAFKKNEFSHLFNMFREIISKKLKILMANIENSYFCGKISLKHV